MKSLIKRAALLIAIKSGSTALASRWSRNQLRILGYHGGWVTPGYQYSDKMYLPIEQFRARMRWLKASRYQVLPLQDALRHLQADTLPPNSVALTFDDGWSTVYSHMLPILEELGLPATIYVTTWYVRNRLPVLDKAVDFLVAIAAVKRIRLLDTEFDLTTHSSSDVTRQIVRLIEQEPKESRLPLLVSLSESVAIPVELWYDSGQFHLMDSEQIKDADARGFDIQLHTHRHTEIDENIDSLAGEIAENRAELLSHLPSKQFAHFCYPSGCFHPDAPAVLRDSKIESASLCRPGLNQSGCDLMTLRRFLDGRSVSQELFEVWLSGLSSLYSRRI